MAIDIIYANTDDYTVTSSDPDWETARAGANLAADIVGFSYLNPYAYLDGDYAVGQAFLHFDNSGITGTVSAPPTLNIKAEFATGSEAIEAAEKTWSGSGTGNFTSSLSADYGATTVNSTGWATLTKATASLSLSSSYGLCLFAQRQRTNTPPTGFNQISFASANTSGTTSDPYLSVTTVTSTAYTLTADGGTFALAGQTAGLKAARKVAAASGAFALSGGAAGVKAGRRFIATSGVFAFTGQAAGLSRGKLLVAETGTFALAGGAAALRRGIRLSAEAGSFVVSGGETGLRIGYRLVANAGDFTLAGQPVVMISTNWTFTPDASAGNWNTTEDANTDWTFTQDASPGAWAA